MATASELTKLARQVSQKPNDCRIDLMEIYKMVKSDPTILKEVTEHEVVGKSFLIMMNYELSDDIDILQMISNISYLFISKAIVSNPSNINL